MEPSPAPHAEPIAAIDPPPARANGWLARRARPVAALVRRLGPAGPMGMITLLLPPIGAAALLGSLPWILPYVRQGTAGLLLCVGVFVVLAGLAIVPTAVLALFAGFAFGFARGLPVAMAGYTGASLIAYLLSGRIAGGHVHQLMDNYPRWNAVHDALLGSSFRRVLSVILLLRLGPVPPFAMTNYALGATGVALPPFVLGTAIGIIPRTAAMVFLGTGVKEFNAEGLRSADAPWLMAGGAVATVLSTVVLTWWSKRALDRITAPAALALAPAQRATQPNHEDTPQ